MSPVTQQTGRGRVRWVRWVGLGRAEVRSDAGGRVFRLDARHPLIRRARTALAGEMSKAPAVRRGRKSVAPPSDDEADVASAQADLFERFRAGLLVHVATSDADTYGGLPPLSAADLRGHPFRLSDVEVAALLADGELAWQSSRYKVVRSVAEQQGSAQQHSAPNNVLCVPCSILENLPAGYLNTHTATRDTGDTALCAGQHAYNLRCAQCACETRAARGWPASVVLGPTRRSPSIKRRTTRRLPGPWLVTPRARIQQITHSEAVCIVGNLAVVVRHAQDKPV